MMAQMAMTTTIHAYTNASNSGVSTGMYIMYHPKLAANFQLGFSRDLGTLQRPCKKTPGI